jgi:protein ImuA
MFRTVQAHSAETPAFLNALPAVHELRAPAGTAGHAGLAVLLLAEFWKDKPVLWVSAAPDCYPPGLAWRGMDPRHCLFAAAEDDAQALGSAEVALRGGMAGVVECRELSRLAARRLALAARQGSALGLVLRHAPARTRQDSTAFASRWMVHPAPGTPDAPRWRAQLLYARGAMPGEYLFEGGGENAVAPPAVAALRRAG